jgi:hypothetical protein
MLSSYLYIVIYLSFFNCKNFLWNFFFFNKFNSLFKYMYI